MKFGQRSFVPACRATGIRTAASTFVRSAIAAAFVAAVPSVSVAADACDTTPQALPKRVAICGADDYAWTSALAVPHWMQPWIWITGTAQLEQDWKETFVLMDNSGAELAKVSPIELNTTILPTNTTDFAAHNYDNQTGILNIGMFMADASFTPKFQYQVFVSDFAYDVTTTIDNKLVLTQNLDTTIETIVWNPDGSVAGAKRFTSSDFGVPSSPFPFPGLGQSVGMITFPDASFMLMVRKTSVNTTTFEVSSELILVKLTSALVVEWSKKYNFGVNFSPPVVAPVDGGGYYITSTLVDPFDTSESPPIDNVVAKLSATGDVVWSKKITAPDLLLNPVPNLAGMVDETIVLSGFRFDAETSASSIVLAAVGSGGTLDAQTEYNPGFSNFAFVTVKGNDVFVTTRVMTEEETNSPGFLDGRVDVGVTNLSLTPWDNRTYTQDRGSGYVAPDYDSNTIYGSFFSGETGAVDIFTMDKEFNVDGAECDLFTPAPLTFVDPELTIEDAPGTVMDVSVTGTDFTPEADPGSLSFMEPTCNQWDICDFDGTGGGGGGGGGISLTSTSTNIGAQGGTVGFGVNADQAEQYTISPNASWVTVDFPNGGAATGSTDVSLVVAPNLTNAAREAEVSVGAEDTFTVSQAAMSGEVEVISTGSTDIGTGTGGGIIQFLSQVPWEVLVPSWVEVQLPDMMTVARGDSPSAVSGSPGLVEIEWSVSNGAPLTDRSGNVDIVDGEGNVLQSVPITQTGVGGAAPINMSARTQVGAGDKILIPGLVVGGAGKTKVLVRGVGPTLTDFGVQGVLPDPEILLFDQGGVQIGANDSWVDDADTLQPLISELGAFGLTSDLDSAGFFELDPGGYTVQLRDTAGGTGVGLVELYVIDASASGGLVNLSARAEVGSGPLVMIPGFVITGDQSVQVLVRGVGPTLGTLGVQGVLEDPVIEVYDAGSQLIASNDDWDAGLSTTFASVGAFALDADSADAAILFTAEPGAYTAQIKGKETAVGVALLEVYFLITY